MDQSTKVTSTEDTPMILDESTIKECIERDQLIKDISGSRGKLNIAKVECDKIKYAPIKEIFDTITPGKKYTIKNLLKALFKLVKSKKISNLSMLDFINYFPCVTTASDETSSIRFNFKRQHVFEALCRILLVLNYDKDLWGKKKEFFLSLEKYKSADKPREKDDIFSQDINDGSAAGSVDIFFKIPASTARKQDTNMVSRVCSTINTSKSTPTTPTSPVKELFIMIQNKFFTNEYAAANKYDVHTILNKTLSADLTVQSGDKKLILMVNNKQSLLSRIKWTNMVSENDILGVVELNEWFMEMIYDMEKASDFEVFYKETKKESGLLQPKFHQQLFINSTLKHLEQGNKKFVWGAVPRSGKSYMIGGLISERQRNVIIVLGAKTETEEQFFNMFKDNKNFENYGIIRDTKSSSKEPKKLNIILISQEKLKINLNTSSEKGKDRAKKLLEECFKYIKGPPQAKPSLDVYFDEIHKGGSTEKASQYILETLIDNYNIELFAMVTATYAKPTIAYSKIIDPNPPVIITWTYSDQQLMKKITDGHFKDSIIESRTQDIQREVFKNLFIEYEKRYQDQYLSILQKEYSKYPELVLCQPESLLTSYTALTGNTFKLKCSDTNILPKEAKKGSLYNAEEIFLNKTGIIKLLNYIGNMRAEGDGKVLEENSVYGKLTYDMKYDVLNKCHTELWFLPSTNLYDECDIKPEKPPNIEETGEEDPVEKTDSLPHIEPLCRGMVALLLENDLFRTNYCFLIVHGQKLTYLNPGSNIKSIFGKDSNQKEPCVYFSGEKNKDSINQFIREKETETFKLNKSLIILTGSMLRLGISLEYADIAFNFDSISSIDLNYQTMFRVLTEHTNKKYGYYFDFNTERPMKFLYEFNQRYGSSTDTMGESVKQLQSLLYLFNYNGLGVMKKDAMEQLELYNKMHKVLELDEEHYGQYFVTNGEKSIIAQLAKHPISDDINKKILQLQLNQRDIKRPNIKHKAKEGTKLQTHKLQVIPEEDKPKEDTPEEEDDSTISHKELGAYINDYVSIIALFSKEYGCAIETEDMSIIDCVKGIKKGIKEKLESNLDDDPEEEFCDCADINVLGCYMERLNGYDAEKFIKSLDTFKDIIESNLELLNIINIIFSKISKEMGKDDMLIEKKSPVEIQEIIERYLPVRQSEKDKFGEVFTPVVLINEMLDKLPKAVWSIPEYKWLDPANGIGNFPMMIYTRLMEGLDKKIENNEARQKHIIENMLYMVELNEKNVAISRKIFGPKANIYCGSFLSYDDKKKKTEVNPEIFKKFKVEKYNIIVGNPPFNKEQIGTREGSYGGKSLWDKFIYNSLDILNKDGYLGFINPAGWRGLGQHHELWEILSDKQLLYLHIYGEKAGNRLFKVGSRFDLYILQNKENTKPSDIIDENGEKHKIKVNEWEFLPNYDYEQISKIITTEEKGLDVIYSRSMYGTDKKNMKDHETKEYKYPVVHSIIKEALSIKWYSNDNTKGHFGVSKVILNFNRHQYAHPEQNDYKGEYGMSQISFGIPINQPLGSVAAKKEGDKILKAINTPAFKEIIKSTKWGAFQTDYRMFKYFKKDFWKEFDDKSKKSESKSKQEQQESKEEEEPEKSKEKGTLLSAFPPKGRTRCPRGTKVIPKSNPKRCTKKTKSKKSLTKSLGKGAGRKRKKTLRRRRRRSKYTTIKKRRLK